MLEIDAKLHPNLSLYSQCERPSYRRYFPYFRVCIKMPPFSRIIPNLGSANLNYAWWFAFLTS